MDEWFYNESDDTTNMDKNALAALGKFNSNYELIVAHHITADSQKQTLGVNNKKCRFCARSTPEVTFKQVAHALPHCIGNNSLFTYNECDACNNKFGRLLETHFANFMNLDHTIVGIKGKRGYPKYKMDNAQIETTGTSIDWTDIPPENIDHDPENGILRITQKMPGYIPVALYKSFVKMALTIMPEKEITYLSRTMDWINEDKHHDSKFTFESLCIFHGKVDSSERESGISAIVIKRKEATDIVDPYLMFRLTYGSFMFQVPIPLCDKDALHSFSSFPYMPTLPDLKYGFNKMQLGLMNLRITETVKTEMTVVIKDIDGTGTVTYLDE